jgi:glutamine amidotransferase
MAASLANSATPIPYLKSVEKLILKQEFHTIFLAQFCIKVFDFIARIEELRYAVKGRAEKHESRKNFSIWRKSLAIWFTDLSTTLFVQMSWKHMRKLIIGLVDYGIGNHASVKHVLHELEFRCKVSKNAEELQESDLILLPGVGAFPPAMAALQAHGLDQVILEHFKKGTPLIGICLGMELFAQESTENGKTKGLGILPGIIDALPNHAWHIGWNTIKVTSQDGWAKESDTQCFFFNHSFSYQNDSAHSVFTSTHEGQQIVAAVRKDNAVGFQFHPEKSQLAGRALLKRTIEGLCHA